MFNIILSACKQPWEQQKSEEDEHGKGAGCTHGIGPPALVLHHAGYGSGKEKDDEKGEEKHAYANEYGGYGSIHGNTSGKGVETYLALV